jgi:predicted nucleic acid-binding protein
MTYLADVNVLSEGLKPRPDPRVSLWLEENEGEVVVDPVILGEIYAGILLLPAGKRRTQLEHWFHRGIRPIVCLPWEPETALRWATLVAKLKRGGRTMPLTESMIAATALAYDLTVVKRNVQDFLSAGVKVINPFE